MFSFLKLIRFQNLIIIAFTQYVVRWCLVYPILKAQSSYYTLQLSEIQFFLLVLSTVMIAAAGHIINDYFDVRIDKVNKPERLIIDNGVKRRIAMGAHVVINILAFLIAIYVSYSIGAWKLACIHFICASGLWYYSTTFKRQFLTGNIIIAVLTALVPVIVVVYELLPCYKAYLPLDENLTFKGAWVYVGGVAFFGFMTTLLHEIIKDIKNYEGDKEYGFKTMPVLIGIKASKTIAVIIAAATMVCLFLIQLKLTDSLTFYYFTFALQIPFAFLIYKIAKADTKKSFQTAGNITKIILLAGISYLFVFAYTLLDFLHSHVK